MADYASLKPRANAFNAHTKQNYLFDCLIGAPAKRLNLEIFVSAVILLSIRRPDKHGQASEYTFEIRERQESVPPPRTNIHTLLCWFPFQSQSVIGPAYSEWPIGWEGACAASEATFSSQ